MWDKCFLMSKSKKIIIVLSIMFGLMVQGCSNVDKENNNKYESIYLDIKQNQKATIQNENEYQPTTLNEAEAKFDEEGNLWITYYNYASMQRDLMILYQDGTKNEYKTYSPHGDLVFYEANVKGDYISDNDKAKKLCEEMISKFNGMKDSHKEATQ